MTAADIEMTEKAITAEALLVSASASLSRVSTGIDTCAQRAQVALQLAAQDAGVTGKVHADAMKILDGVKVRPYLTPEALLDTAAQRAAIYAAAEKETPETLQRGFLCYVGRCSRCRGEMCPEYRIGFLLSQLEVLSHDCAKSGCGPVCTANEW
jgi:hypothetical protein